MVATDRNVFVEMPDGVLLATDVHHPDGVGAVPTLLQRTCYDKDVISEYIGLEAFLGSGYRVVLQDCRGSGASGGEQDHFAEAPDGRATADWIAEQPWFDGALGTFGSSYMGMTQWALAASRPPHLKAMAVGLCNSRVRSWFPGGSLALDIFLPWSVTRAFTFQELQQPEYQERLQAAFMHLPIREAAKVATGRDLPWYDRWMDHPSAEDPFWQPLDFSGAVDLDIPILFLDQWYDYATAHLVKEFEQRQGAGRPSRLHVGPGTHFSADSTQLGETLAWFDQHLKGGVAASERCTARIFVLPEVGWRDLPAWPPQPDPQSWYLSEGGHLGAAPSDDASQTPFDYDPADPTPAVGGPSLRLDNCGPQDNRALEDRVDVLTFTSEPLAEPVTVIGVIPAEIHLSSDVSHLDLYLRLCDVDAAGVSTNMSEVLQRLTPELIERRHDGTFQVSLDLRPIAYRFGAGHRIRLQVSGGAHPMLARNTCSGEPPVDATRIVVAHNSVHHDRVHLSRIVLPLCDGAVT